MCRTYIALYLQSFILGASGQQNEYPAVESLRSDEKNETEQHCSTGMKNWLFFTEKEKYMLHFFSPKGS